MRFLKINQYESRQLSIALSEGKYKKWMRRYLDAKDFYKLKSLISLEGNSFKDIYIHYEEIILEKLKMKISYKNYIYLTKMAYTLLLLNLLKGNKKKNLLLKVVKDNDYELLKSSLSKNNISLINSNILMSFLRKINRRESEQIKVFLFAPICPDYATSIDNNGKERYTFNGLGNGVGLVGRKFLDNINSLIDSFKIVNIEIQPIVLLGDFENNESNLKRLKISNDCFMNSIKSSKEVFERKYNMRAELFADYFGGIASWKKRINNLKNELSFSNINSLEKSIPLINHHENFISRIPLYKRWYGESDQMMIFFINQIYEYILMGNLVSGFHKPSILLSSDHKAMAPYFSTGFNSIPVLSLNNVY